MMKLKVKNEAFVDWMNLVTVYAIIMLIVLFL